ncbi:MAG: hypothetical protein Q7S68_04900 [Deltaproteobacteria bacterium]|nr:hypothetical protein [Deltaproteobacteria bacterium]
MSRITLNKILQSARAFELDAWLLQRGVVTKTGFRIVAQERVRNTTVSLGQTSYQTLTSQTRAVSFARTFGESQGIEQSLQQRGFLRSALLSSNIKPVQPLLRKGAKLDFATLTHLNIKETPVVKGAFNLYSIEAAAPSARMVRGLRMASGLLKGSAFTILPYAALVYLGEMSAEEALTTMFASVITGAIFAGGGLVLGGVATALRYPVGQKGSELLLPVAKKVAKAGLQLGFLWGGIEAYLKVKEKNYAPLEFDFGSDGGGGKM